MKERHLFTLLSVEAAACVLFCILQRSLSGLFSTLIAFPFEQIRSWPAGSVAVWGCRKCGRNPLIHAVGTYPCWNLGIPALAQEIRTPGFHASGYQRSSFCNPILHDQSGTFVHRSTRHREMVPGKYLLFRPSGLPAYPHFASL